MGFLTSSLVRALLPAILLAAILLRPFGLSVVYLLIYLIAPLMSVPNKQTFCSWPGKFLLLTVVLSCILLLLHAVSFAFSIIRNAYTLENSLEDEFLDESTGIENIGDSIAISIGITSPFPYEDGQYTFLHRVLPELIVVIGSLLIYFLVRRICLSNSDDNEDSSNEYIEYYCMQARKNVVVLLIMVSGALEPSITSGVYFLTFVGIALAWAWGKDLVQPFPIICRCLMLFMGVHVSALLCFQTIYVASEFPLEAKLVRYMGMEQLIIFKETEFNYNWQTRISPLVILVTYCLLPLVTSDTARKIINPPPEREFLRRSIRRLRLRLKVASSFIGKMENTSTEKYNHYDLLECTLEIYKNIVRSFYMSMIVSMWWSIQYPSWPGLVMLVWAYMTWLFRNHRVFMTRTSPFLICFSVTNLVAQYVYAMNFTEDELPRSFFDNSIKLYDFGIAREKKSSTTLIAQSVFTCLLCIAQRQRQKADSNTEEEGYQSVLLRKVMMKLHALCVRVWIYLVAAILLFISFYDDQVTIIDVIYLVLFLLFVFMYQVSNNVWRRLLYPFCIIVIVYATVHLMLIYSYPLMISVFEWTHGQTLTGLETQSRGSKLFYSLLIPTGLIFVTVLQIQLFHKDYVEWLKPQNSLEQQPDISIQVNKDSIIEKETTHLSYDEKKSIDGEIKETCKVNEKKLSNAYELEEITSSTASIAPSTSVLIERDTIEKEQEFEEHKTACQKEKQITTWRQTVQRYQDYIFILLEMYLATIIFFIIMCTCLLDVSLINLPLMIIVTLTLLLRKKKQQYCLIFISFLMSVFLIAKMSYQIDVFQEAFEKLFQTIVRFDNDNWNTTHLDYIIKNCTKENEGNEKDLAIEEALFEEWTRIFGIPYKSPLTEMKTLDNLFEAIANNLTLPEDFNGTQPITETESKKNISDSFASLIGLSEASEKLKNLYIIQNYMGLILLITVFVFVKHRQNELRKTLRLLPDCRRIVSYKVTREDADKDAVHCLKYFLIYGFYKFGVEMNLVCLAVAIAHRMDVFAIWYITWLVILVSSKRKLQAKLWPIFTISILILVLVQYILVLKLLPLIAGLDWFGMLWTGSHLETIMRLNWLFIPVDHVIQIDGSMMYYDCGLLILSIIQLRIFKEEQDLKESHPGGSNDLPISEEWENNEFINPIKDFLCENGTWLDKMKCALFIIMPSISVAAVVVVAIDDVNIFSVGYFIGSFIFFWHGNNIFLRPKNTLLLWWSRMLYYNVFVLAIKVLIRIPACVYINYISYFEKNTLSLYNVFGINCYDAYKMISQDLKCVLCNDNGNLNQTDTILDNWCWSADSEQGLNVENSDNTQLGEAICFALLLLQRRMFHSYYYHRVVDDFKASFVVASKGLTIYQELFRKRLQRQIYYERTIKEKIKVKLRKIINQVILEDHLCPDDSHLLNNQEASHQKVIRSGDYHMFKEIDDHTTNVSVREDNSDEEAPDEEYFKILKSTCYSRETSTINAANELLIEERENNTTIQDPVSFMENAKRLCSRLNILISEILLKLTIYILKASRDYRYVSRILTKDKNILKESEEFKIGVRKNSCMIWEPLPQTLQSTSVAGEPKDQSINTTNKIKSPYFHFFNAIYYAILANTDKICYIAVFLNQIHTAALISLPLPLMVFLWGTLTTPRPSKKFWITLIIYTMIIILVKTMFQSKTIPWAELNIYNDSDDPFSIPAIIGIERKKNFALWDLLLLVALFLHRYNLEAQGLWVDSTNANNDNPNDVGFSTANETKADDNSNDDHSVTENDTILSEERDKKRFCPHIFSHLLSGESRIATDLYAFMFFCDFINIFIVIFNYPAFGRFQSSLQEYLVVNKVPLTFLVMLILQFGLIVVDRAIYLWKFIVCKIYLQFVLVIGVHVWMFFVLPLFTETKFNSVLTPPMWYMFKCVYLLLAAHQIRSGYPPRTFGNIFCKSYKLMNMIMFRVYMAIPFLFEVRNILDWICTDTSMTIIDWLKMEDMYAHIFLLKCSRTIDGQFPQPRATKKKKLTKCLLGGALFLVVINIVWFPLLFFAFGNAIGKPNPPTEVTLQIQLGSYQPIYQNTAITRNIKTFTPEEYERIMKLDGKTSGIRRLFADYEPEDIARVYFPRDSVVKWDLTPSDRTRFRKDLLDDSNMPIRIKYIVKRRSHGANNLQVLEDNLEREFQWRGRPKLREKFMLKILYDLATVRPNATDGEFWTPISNIFPRHVKVSNNEGLKFLNVDLDQGTMKYSSPYVPYDHIELTVRRYDTDYIFWSIQDVRDKVMHYTGLFNTRENSSEVAIIVYNDRIFKGTFDSLYVTGIIGLYTTFVLVAARLTRSFSSGSHRRVMFNELPNVDRVLQLCHDIYLVREAQEWDLEESLFAKLLFLYRSPETMIKWSRFPRLQNVPPSE